MLPGGTGDIGMSANDDFDALMAHMDDDTTDALLGLSSMLDNPVAFIVAEGMLKASRDKAIEHFATCDYCNVYKDRLDAYFHMHIVLFTGFHDMLIERGRVVVEKFEQDMQRLGLYDHLTKQEAFAMGIAVAIQLAEQMKDISKASKYIEEHREQ